MENLTPKYLTEEMNNFECKKLREVASHGEGRTKHGLKG
jgi:hypothetical protein